MPALQAKLEDYRSRDTVPGHYNSIDTGMTEGDYFDSLDAEGKGKTPETRNIRVEKATPALEPGASKGIRKIIDGEDLGVYPYPPAYGDAVAQRELPHPRPTA